MSIVSLLRSILQSACVGANSCFCIVLMLLVRCFLCGHVYTQGLNRLAAIALLVLNEEDAFW